MGLGDAVMIDEEQPAGAGLSRYPCREILIQVRYGAISWNIHETFARYFAESASKIAPFVLPSSKFNFP